MLLERIDFTRNRDVLIRVVKGRPRRRRIWFWRKSK